MKYKHIDIVKFKPNTMLLYKSITGFDALLLIIENEPEYLLMYNFRLKTTYKVFKSDLTAIVYTESTIEIINEA